MEATAARRAEAHKIMKYSPEQLKDIHAAIDAHNEGKLVEQLLGSVGGVWRPFDGQWCLGGRWLYRPKPGPKTRPWSKPDDVPGPVCWIRCYPSDDCPTFVIGFHSKGVRTVYDDGDSIFFAWSKMHEYEYSTDWREWKPCQVTKP